MTSLSVFLLHGVIFLSLKTDDELRTRSELAAIKLWLPALIFVFLLAVATFFYTDFIKHLGIFPVVFPFGALVTILLSGWFISRKQDGWAFTMTALNILLTLVTFFLIMFPRVMISNIDPAFSLDI